MRPRRLCAALLTGTCLLLAGLGCSADEKAGVPASAPALQAKRVGPPAVAAVVVGGVRYEALPWGKKRGLGQNGGYLATFDVKTGAELGLIKVYEIKYEPKLEADVQDDFIARLQVVDGSLAVTDERGRRYLVDLITKSVRAVQP
ncbi:MAG TPA: hypothetical protein VGD54_14110 [Steroidobacteraceae bacterium]